MRKFRIALMVGVTTALMVAATADASITAPTVDVTPLFDGVKNAIVANLPTLLLGAGVLGGVAIVLSMAKRWFGARRIS
jgi:hypothetical protein